MSMLPYRHIGVIRSRSDELQAWGTGILMSNDLVLTCAHNIYNRKNRCYYSQVEFYPGQYG